MSRSERNFARRIEAIDRISQAAGGLDDRIGEIAQQEAALDQLDSKLAELTDYLIAAQDAAKLMAVAAAASAVDVVIA